MAFSTASSIKQRICKAEQLFSEWESCTLCDLHEVRDEAGGLILPGHGWTSESPYKLAIITDRHDPQEVAAGNLMDGAHGVVLRRVLDYCQVDLDDVWVTGPTLCPTAVHDTMDEWRPPELQPKPKPKHVAACRQRLHQELHILQPRIVVTMGAMALQTLTNNPKIKYTDLLGQIGEVKISGDFVPYVIPVFVTHSLNVLLRNVNLEAGGEWHRTAAHLDAVFRLLDTYEELEAASL